MPTGVERVARKRALQFVVATLAASYLFEALLIARGGHHSLGQVGSLVLMWLPGVVALALTLATRGRVKDLGLTRGTRRSWLLAFVVPAACGAFTYGASLALGLVHFSPPAEAVEAGRASLTHWAIGLPLQLVFGSLIGSVYGLGEELGWRGYLVPRLVKGKVAFALAVSGVIWGLWHLPLILWGGYATSALPWLSAGQFMLLVVPGGIFFGWLRLESGSVFPPMLAHAVHNVVYQSVLDKWFAGPEEPFYAGEQGLFSIVAYGAVALVTLRALRRAGPTADLAQP